MFSLLTGVERRGSFLILLANLLESLSSWRLIVFSHVTGAGMNFKPRHNNRHSKVICSSVFDSVLICCLRDSMLFKADFRSVLRTLGSLFLFFVLLHVRFHKM